MRRIHIERDSGVSGTETMKQIFAQDIIPVLTAFDNVTLIDNVDGIFPRFKLNGFEDVPFCIGFYNSNIIYGLATDSSNWSSCVLSLDSFYYSHISFDLVIFAESNKLKAISFIYTNYQLDRMMIFPVVDDVSYAILGYDYGSVWKVVDDVATSDGLYFSRDYLQYKYNKMGKALMTPLQLTINEFVEDDIEGLYCINNTELYPYSFKTVTINGVKYYQTPIRTQINGYAYQIFIKGGDE